MTISYNWLKEYIDTPESPEELGKLLTSTGLEVESIEPFTTVPGGLEGLVIGEVISCEKHPNADKLSITTVDVGGERHLPIVCGAPNVAAGQRVVVALTGTKLYPTGGEPFTIRKAKIRGEVSEGMICSESEIGLGAGHEGIIVLKTDVPNGTPAASYFNVEVDYAIEIGLTPNRADATSHIGVARDVRAARNRLIKWPAVDHFKTDDNSLPIEVVVKNTEACPRYSGLTISGVTIGESPTWLQNRLRAIGLAPINNVVDITNFVLHELGQPLHAFDVDAIHGRKVIVKTLPEGTPFTTLDGKNRKLSSDDLMICHSGPDAEAGMCIAGVFGGAESGIKETTRNIFLESAHFSAAYVRRTGLRHQLKTDASFRFERGTDPDMTVYALKRAALLIKEIAGGKISSEIVDIYPVKAEHRKIAVKDRNVDRLIGKTIPREEIFSILRLLDIDIVEVTDDQYTVSVPPYRVDVEQEADIIEEILRIYGFNRIELSDRAGAEYLAEFPAKSPDRLKRTLSELLVANGFYEIWTNSLTSHAYQQRHGLTFEGEPVEILNKLSEELDVLRQTMLFTGLEVCAHNINHKQKDLKLFEFGKIYFKKEGKYHEQERLALYLTGASGAEHWKRKAKPVDYYDLMQHIHHITTKTGLKDVRLEQTTDPVFDYAVAIYSGKKRLGTGGKVKANLLKDLGIRQELFFADLDTSLLFKAANPKLVIHEVARFPEVKRDLSLVLDASVTFEEIRNLIVQTEKRLIKDIGVFDVYEGDNIPKEKKAYALSFTLQNENKTLTDEEIDGTMQRLIAAFEQKLGAVIRK